MEQKIIELQKIRPYEITPIKPGEKKINVIFYTMNNQDIENYKLECKSNDLLMNLEEILHKKFPKLKDSDKYYFSNAKEIKRYLTLEQNKIKDNDIINIYINEKPKNIYI